MGINGLLPLLKSISRTVHVENFAGKTVAIDAYSWLHKGAYSCALDLVQGIYSDSYVTYCMNRVNLLLHHNIKPILVFDGGILPSKLSTEHKRKSSREHYRHKAIELLSKGNRKDAYAMSQKCVEITTAVAHRLIEELQKNNIQFIVAPYEADAQMAYLDKIGLVDAIITEDSDLLLFGCRKILFKLDKYGNAEEICIDDLAKAHEFDFPQMTHEQFRQICILSGCDYLDSLPGVGMKTAIKLMKKYNNIDSLLQYLRLTNKSFSSEYENKFLRAELTFKHQRIYDPVQQRLKYLTEPSRETSTVNGVLSPNSFLDDWDEYFGPSFDDSLAQGIAHGIIDPISYERIVPVSGGKRIKQEISISEYFLKNEASAHYCTDKAAKLIVCNDSTDKTVSDLPESQCENTRVTISFSEYDEDNCTISNSESSYGKSTVNLFDPSANNICSYNSLDSGKSVFSNSDISENNPERINLCNDTDKERRTLHKMSSLGCKKLKHPLSPRRRSPKNNNILSTPTKKLLSSPHKMELRNSPIKSSPIKCSLKKSPYFSKLSGKSKFFGVKKQSRLQFVSNQ